MKRLASIPFLAALAAVVFSSTAAPAAQNPIQIRQCYIISPKPLSNNAGGTQIAYINRGKQTATEIDFIVGYRNSAHSFMRRQSDYGQFTPGAAINHRFGLYSDVTYAGKQTHGCYAVKAKWADGTTWTAQ